MQGKFVITHKYYNTKTQTESKENHIFFVSALDEGWLPLQTFFPWANAWEYTGQTGIN